MKKMSKLSSEEKKQLEKKLKEGFVYKDQSHLRNALKNFKAHWFAYKEASGKLNFQQWLEGFKFYEPVGGGKGVHIPRP